MPSLTRIRRALTMPSRPSSTTTTASSSSTDLPSSPTSTTPSSTPSTSKRNSVAELPIMMLTKTTSGLSRFRSGLSRDKEERYRRKVEDWKKKDEAEWEKPSKAAMERRSRKWSKEYQDMLRGFELKCDPRTSLEGGRSDSILYGISPCTTRIGGAHYPQQVEAAA